MQVDAARIWSSTMESSVQLSACSVVSDSATPWTIARQTPLSMGFPRQNGMCCHFFLQGIFPIQGSNCVFCICKGVLYHWATWESRSWSPMGKYEFPFLATLCSWNSNDGCSRWPECVWAILGYLTLLIFPQGSGSSSPLPPSLPWRCSWAWPLPPTHLKLPSIEFTILHVPPQETQLGIFSSTLTFPPDPQIPRFRYFSCNSNFPWF